MYPLMCFRLFHYRFRFQIQHFVTCCSVNHVSTSLRCHGTKVPGYQGTRVPRYQGYLVPRVLGTRVPGTRYRVPATCYQVLGTRCLVPGTRYRKLKCSFIDVTLAHAKTNEIYYMFSPQEGPGNSGFALEKMDLRGKPKFLFGKI